jgi:hypothetical protein
VFDLQLAGLGGGGTGVGEAERGVGVVGPFRLAHEHLDHGADGVELGGAVAAGGVEEGARREAGKQDKAGPGRY